MTGKEFMHKIFSPIIWINLLGMLLVVVLICLGTVWWMKGYTHHGESIDVPNMKGILVSDAQKELEMMQLQGVVIDSTYRKNMPAGTILDQTPKAGQRIKAGREIYFIISTQCEPTLPLPNLNVNNGSATQAEATLQSLGFMIDYEYAEGAKGLLLGIKHKGKCVNSGDRVPKGARLTLVVGQTEMEFDENGEIVDDNWNTDSLGEAYDESEEFVF